MAKPDMAAQLAKAAQDRERRDRMLRENVSEPEMKPAEAVVVEPPVPVPAEPEPAPMPETATIEPEAVPADEAPAPAPEPAKRGRKPQASRQETAAVTVHFPRIVRQQLRLVAAETDRQMQDVIAEGINMVLRKHGKAAVAPRDPKR